MEAIMKAMQINAVQKGVVGLREVALEPLGARQVQVKTAYSVVSPGTERAFTLSLPTTQITYPCPLGYSCSGVVEAVGPEVTMFKPGDYVAGPLLHQSRNITDESNLYHVPEGLSLQDAAFVHVGNISMQAVRHARIELGEAVAVIGGGLIGQLAMHMAKASGAYPLICLEQVESKMKLARETGADFVIDTRNNDWLEQLRAVTGGKGPQVVMEATGYSDPVVDALKAVSDFGRVVLLASTRTESVGINVYQEIHKKGIDVIGAHVSWNPKYDSRPGFWTWRDNSEALLRMQAAGIFQLSHLISHRRPYTACEEIYNGLVVTWNKDFVTCLLDWTMAE
jgi:NADPH:quinone reductase-like Zn-dependent oxidoreductase